MRNSAITEEVWTLRGLVTIYVLFFLNLGSRRVWMAGCTPQPHAAWMAQQARNFSMVVRSNGEAVATRTPKSGVVISGCLGSGQELMLCVSAPVLMTRGVMLMLFYWHRPQNRVV